jgi:beta-lactamase class A
VTGPGGLSVHVAGLASVGSASVVSAPFRAVCPDGRHDAASTMKAAVLAALHRSGLDLDTPVPVVDSFAPPCREPGSATRRHGLRPGTMAAGGRVTLRWLATRMIIRSARQ